MENRDINLNENVNQDTDKQVSSIESNSSDENEDILLKKSKISFIQKIKNYFLPKGIQLDMLRYKPNKLSFNFGIFGFVFLCLGFCVFYSSTEIPTGIVDGFNLFGSKEPGYFLGIDIVLNILIMLFMLYSCIRMKAYYISQGIVSISLGAFQIIRIFLLPLSLQRCSVMSSLIYTLITIFYLISGVSSIIGGFLCIYRGSALKKYLLSLKERE